MKKQKKSKKQILAITLSTLFCIGSIILLIVLLYPADNYYIYLYKSFAYQLICFFLVLAIISVILKNKIASIILFAIFLIATVYVVRFFQNPSYNKSYESDLSIMQMNVFVNNEKMQEVMDVIKKENPDILSIQEFTNDHYELIKEDLDNLYPFSIIEASDNISGIGVFSKRPFNKFEKVYIQDVPVIIANTEIEKQEFNLFATHAPAPLNSSSWNWQKQFFQEFDNLIQGISGDIIIIGDLNTVPWHKELSTIVQNNDLEFAFYNPFGTYPTRNPFIRVPIDHIIMSDGIKTYNTEKIQIPGSDHLGIKSNINF